MPQAPRLVSLYERDFALWLEDVAAKLRSRDFDQLDIDNLVEEIGALGRSDRKEIKSRLVTLLAHLLKRLFIDSAYDNRGWEIRIREQRKELLLLEQSPSLSSYFAEVFDSAYAIALAEVREDYAKVTFPDRWPLSHTVDDLLSQVYWAD
ncbi:DUF29 domain-containing protein [filamentous cyanobacterium CCT1]|nr:DUF29 domain-containing protein [filamentous cyanobacterium CCT1]PSN80152.1 DUF29 domain-containing protein [filamentous cyanobacterium CCP4]